MSRAVRGAAEYAALSRALDEHLPPCTGDPRFILEPQDVHPDELTHLAMHVCRRCPLRDLCRAYGDTARPPAGIWAGKTYRLSQRRKETQ